MRKINPGAALAVAFSFLLAASPVLAATVNHGDFIGTGVDFLQVSETTSTAGDPDVLWDTPVLDGTGTSLLFFPPNYTSSCAAGSSDQTGSQLQTTIMAQGANTIETLTMMEDGDVTLTAFPPFGTPATNATASISGFVTVLEDTGGPIVPVVIPFVGTFLPTGTFSLPGDFGASLWSGSFTVDIAAQVPNATKLQLSLDNDLATNCAPGATSGKIQKKVVSGPGVSIIVNAPECDILLDKKCCVPQPALPDLDICEGEVVSMTLEFTGDSSKASNNRQGGHHRCHGRRRISGPADLWVLDYSGTTTATPDMDIEIGDTVEFTNSTGTLNDYTKFKIQGDYSRKQYTKIDTSCDRALACGDQFGAFKLVGLESTLGGVVDCNAPPPPGECRPPGSPPGTPCDAKLVDMVLEYNGQDCQDPLGNPQSGEASCVGDATGATDVGVIYTGMHPNRQTVSPSSGINDGDLVRVTATFQGGLFPNQKLLITDAGGVRQEVAFHVSCSQPLALGDEFGSFKLVGFTTKTGFQTELNEGGDDGYADSCEVPLAPPGPHCTSDLQELTLVYVGDFLGEGCTVSNSQNGYGTCSGVDDPGDPVSVGVSSGLVSDPDDQVEFGDTVSITADGGGDLPGIIQVDAMGGGGSQEVQIKTSCYKPLSLGDRFGAWVVFGMDREDEGPIELGGNIRYQYEVENPGANAIDNVSIDDDQLGNIVSGETLAGGEIKKFTADATLFGTTTNVATATAEEAGGICTPAFDQVTVDVLAPPPGAFYCSPPITGYTMIWNGAQTVDVKAHAGPANYTPVLAEFLGVAPGTAITVTDSIHEADPQWEIFEAGTTNLIGTSTFNHGCWDHAMNGVEDCGKSQGNNKHNASGLINDWLLEGLVDDDETLECTPGPIPSVPACGLGPELLFLMPGLMWLHRRRLGRKD